jgi:hypothetical protein
MTASANGETLAEAKQHAGKEIGSKQVLRSEPHLAKPRDADDLAGGCQIQPCKPSAAATLRSDPRVSVPCPLAYYRTTILAILPKHPTQARRIFTRLQKNPESAIRLK